MDAFMASNAEDGSQTIEAELANMTATIGEKLSIRRFEKVSTDGLVVSYIHAGGKIGVLVEADTDGNSDAVKEALRNVAMQVAAMNPKYTTQDEVDADYLEQEKEILTQEAKNDPKNAGKPDNIIEKMIVGRLNKEMKEICLVDQVYVKAEDGKQSVAKYIESVAKAEGVSLSIKRFIRFETGEGLEKKNEDFAAEVAAQIAGK
jgi:elongation factor Ts